MKASPLMIAGMLLALAFTLATNLDLPACGWSRNAKSDNVFGMVFGDGRKLFANHFFTMADVYFHSGYYPSIFDKKDGETKAIVNATRGHDGECDHAGCDHEQNRCEHADHEGDECEKNGGFLGGPKDWVESFGRNFRITDHTHLDNNQQREILPWLRLAAELDPEKTETYTVGAFFLREHLKRPEEAEAFLREGFRRNPDSLELIFELGRLCRENTRNPFQARNLWELGIRKYSDMPQNAQRANNLVFEQIVVHLGQLEEESGNYIRALNCFKMAQAVSPAPQNLQGRIDILQKKINESIPGLPAPLF